ncbi:hypothetical protein, partial [Pseudomonas mosselii]
MDKDTLERSINAALVVFILSLFIQVVSKLLFGSIVDYSMLIGGEPSRNMMTGVGFRPTGLTAEPSVYCG